MCEVKDGTFHFPSGLPLEGQTVYRDIYDAFIFYFPVVATEVFGRGTGAVNVFRHAPGIARIADRIPGGVNRDTVYSCAFSTSPRSLSFSSAPRSIASSR